MRARFSNLAWSAIFLLLLPLPYLAGGNKWDSLRQNNPFAAKEPPPPEPPPPQLELRGVLVEGREIWFNLYNGETKESAWVQKGEKMTAYVVKDYDGAKEALTLEFQQRSISVALKQSKMQLLATSHRGPTAVASRGGASPLPAMAAMASPPPPASESKRLEQVAIGVRQQREQRKKQVSQAAVSQT